MTLALITGASAGIGREFARYHASKRGDLVLVARRYEALEELKEELEREYSVKVTFFAMDLAKPGAAKTLFDRVEDAGLKIDILINNAGFGGRGYHIERELSEELEMVDLNVKTLMALCHMFGFEMAHQPQKGRILNVGSTAGFMPGPLQATYFGTKAFVNSYTQALDHELRPLGVTCTLLAPGYVETEFAERADLTDTELTKSGSTPDKVAAMAYEAMLRGDLMVINDPKLRFAINWLIPLAPRRLVMKITEKLQSK